MKIKRAIEKIWASPLVYTVHSRGVDRAKAGAIRRLGGDWRGKRVLDLGCGTGNSASLFTGADYTGIDINPAYVAAARRRFPAVRFIAADAGRADWGGSFDAILLNSFLHHLPDRAAGLILGKTARALAPAGLAIIQEPLVPGPGEWYHRLLMKLDRGGYFRSLEEWLALAEGAGLRPEVKGRYELRVLGLKGYHMVSISAGPISEEKDVSVQ